MDDRGYWHNTGQIDALKAQLQDEREGTRHGMRPRFVIAFEIGQTVQVTRGSDTLLAVFDGADKNKVTLSPIDEAGKARPYLELAERVTLSDGKTPGVNSQVWDNRGGKLILRTLPV